MLPSDSAANNRSAPAVAQIQAPHEGNEAALIFPLRLGVDDHGLLVMREHAAHLDPSYQAFISPAVSWTQPALDLPFIVHLNHIVKESAALSHPVETAGRTHSDPFPHKTIKRCSS